MGHGKYSDLSRSVRYTSMGFAPDSGVHNDDIFKQNKLQQIHELMKVGFRESRDSEEHPNTISIMIFLDVTGSMGVIPREFIGDGLPTIMNTVFSHGIKDPQILFGAIGDHEYDNAPIQVGQFESSDELIDKWLQNVWLEKGGGGNAGESYLLAWAFASMHTALDSFEKRGQKGFLFTVGDEPTLMEIPANVAVNLGFPTQLPLKAKDLLAKAQEKYHVFHFNTTETYSGARDIVKHQWNDLLGQNAIMVDDYKKIPNEIGKIIASYTTTGFSDSANTSESGEYKPKFR